MSEDKKRFVDAGENTQQQSVGVGRSFVKCLANGCPLCATLVTNVEPHEGLCDFHSEVPAENWGKVSALLRTKSFLRLLNAIRLTQKLPIIFSEFGSNKDPARPFVVETFLAAQVLGLPEDSIKPKQEDFSGEKVSEHPQAYVRRIHQLAILMVKERFKGVDVDNSASGTLAAQVESLANQLKRFAD